MKKKVLVGLLFSTLLFASCSENSVQSVNADTDIGKSYQLDVVKNLDNYHTLYRDSNKCYWIGGSDGTMAQVMERSYYNKIAMPMCDKK